jgi:hypothetical protein
MPDDPPPNPPDASPVQGEAPTAPVGEEPGFARSDWFCFAITATAALTLYLVTLAPDVSLGFSGIFATGGMYAGVAHPPGYPLSTLWAWLFIYLVPVGTVAWRAALSSAVAGALACGVIALMVSRMGSAMAARLREGQPPPRKWQNRLRLASGFAAGMSFGANGPFWSRAVIPDVWTLSILLLCLVLGLLLRWMLRPEQKRFLFAAAFVYGLALTNSQIQLSLLPAIPFLVWVGNRHLARDMFFTGVALGVVGVIGSFQGWFAFLGLETAAPHPLFRFLLFGGAMAFAISFALVLLTRRLFTEWQTLLGCTTLFLLGLSLYFYVPVASMTNPPLNWGYARTVQGFFHTIRRGQYERIHPTETLSAFAKQSRAYGTVATKQLGWPCVLLALAPFLLLRRLGARARGWLLALLAAYLCLAFLMLAVLNPSVDRQSLELNDVFFSASYVVLALWAGCGLAVVGSLLLKSPPLSA